MPQGPPIHTSVTWPSIQELFVTISEAALEPVTAYPRSHEEEDDGKWMRYGIAFGAVVCAGAAAVIIWKRASGGTVGLN